jgi:hypothetical protein
MVKLFDRGDGYGANWGLMLESLYRAGFAIVDERPDDEARRKLMQQVHEEAEVRLTGGYADGSASSKSHPDETENAPSNTAIFKPPSLRPHR